MQTILKRQKVRLKLNINTSKFLRYNVEFFAAKIFATSLIIIIATLKRMNVD